MGRSIVRGLMCVSVTTLLPLSGPSAVTLPSVSHFLQTRVQQTELAALYWYMIP